MKSGLVLTLNKLQILEKPSFAQERSYPRQSEPLCAGLSPSFFFPEAKSANTRSKKSKWKIFRSCHDAEPSGLSLALASSRWRRKSTVSSVRSGAELGAPDCFLPIFSRVYFVKVQSLSKKTVDL
jgi:hypothetical protein